MKIVSQSLKKALAIKKFAEYAFIREDSISSGSDSSLYPDKTVGKRSSSLF